MDPEQIPLRDLHLPELISRWPLAPGWWVVIGAGLVGLVFLFRHWLRTRSHNAARRYALRQLQQIVSEYDDHKNVVEFAARISELLRRTMLAYAPRLDVAGLAGEEWLEWLDHDLAQPVFVCGPGRQLLELPYRDRSASQQVHDLPLFVAAVRHRLATPIGAQG